MGPHPKWLAALVLATGVTVVAVGQRVGDDREPAATAPPSTTAPPTVGLFAEPTGEVLVLDDGYDGVLALDLDRRTATRRVLEGQRAGDQSPRLHRAGDDFVVGWDGVWAAPVDGGPSRRLGRATTAIPAAEPGRVWLSWYPGRRIGAGSPIYALVDVASGDEVVVHRGPPEPAILGIPGGLALQAPGGIELWDATSGRVEQRLGGPSGFPTAIHGDVLAWCSGECPELHLTDLATGTEVVVPTPPGTSWFDGYEGAFSPDGRHLAAWAEHTPVLVDVETGAVEVLGRGGGAYGGNSAWSPDGATLYWTIRSEDATRLGRLDLATGDREVVQLAVTGGDLVVLDAAEAEGLLVEPTGPPRACPRPGHPAQRPHRALWLPGLRVSSPAAGRPRRRRRRRGARAGRTGRGRPCGAGGRRWPGRGRPAPRRTWPRAMAAAWTQAIVATLTSWKSTRAVGRAEQVPALAVGVRDQEPEALALQHQHREVVGDGEGGDDGDQRRGVAARGLVGVGVDDPGHHPGQAVR